MVAIGFLSGKTAQVYDRCRRAASVQTRESIGAPVLAADTVMQEEEAVGIIFLLDGEKPGVVFAPERLLPMRLEIIGLPYIGANARQELADCVHRFVHSLGLGPRGRRVRLMAGNAGISGRSEIAGDPQREGGRDGWVHRRILRRDDRVRGRSRY